MIDPELQQRFDALEKKVDAVYKSSEKMRRYFLWTFIIGAVAFIGPLIILPFIIPSFLSTYGVIGSIQ